MVETPVVEGNEAGDEVGLRSWCQQICDGLEDCPDELDYCLPQCVALFQDFEGKNDVCADAGRRAMSCLEQTRCTGLEGVEGCSVSGERERCLASRGQTSCQSGENLAEDAQDCGFRFSYCSSGDEFTLDCSVDADGTRCTCMTGDIVNGEFAPAMCPSVEDVLRICAWPAVYPPGVPTPPPAARCQLGGSSSPGGAGVECSMNFVQCSDGHTYGVNCVGAERAVRCDCMIDDEVDSVYSSPDGICSFALADDDGRTALNYACGFSIAAFR